MENFIEKLDSIGINPICIKPYLTGYRIFCNDEKPLMNNIVKLRKTFPLLDISWDAIEYNQHPYIIITAVS